VRAVVGQDQLAGHAPPEIGGQGYHETSQIVRLVEPPERDRLDQRVEVPATRMGPVGVYDQRNESSFMSAGMSVKVTGWVLTQTTVPPGRERVAASRPHVHPRRHHHQLSVLGAPGFTPPSLGAAVPLLPADAANRAALVGDTVILDEVDDRRALPGRALECRDARYVSVVYRLRGPAWAHSTDASR
jgi:hypothetical protein